MKTIILMPTKNEEWILPITISAASSIAEKIIVSDQKSQDKTIEILKKSNNIDFIENKNIGHSNQVRWELLDYARSNYGKNNLIITIDADEIIPHSIFKNYRNNILSNKPGTIFSLPWIQLWKSVEKYRSDKGVWSPKTNKKACMFIDDGILSYDNKFVINDHTSRVPNQNIRDKIDLQVPLLHFQFANWERSQIKQIWYQCTELLNGLDPETINNKYFHSKNQEGVKLRKVKKSWLKNISITNSITTSSIPETWYFSEIKEMFNKYGIKKFEKLDIWDNKYIQSLIN